MRPLGELSKRVEKLVIDNSPAILTAIGVTGVVMTAYLTGRASFKAALYIRAAESRPDTRERKDLPNKEKIEIVWKLYIPAVGTGALTIAAIVCANRIGTRRAAAMAAAYSLSERAFTEYRTKIVEKLGENKEREVRDEIAQDRVNKTPPSTEVVIGSGSVLCYDTFTGRYFQSDMETLRKAQNDINHQVLRNSYASLTDFYDLIGLPSTALSDDVGWNSDTMLELRFSAVLIDSRPCMTVDFAVAPVRHYYRLR